MQVLAMALDCLPELDGKTLPLKAKSREIKPEQTWNLLIFWLVFTVLDFIQDLEGEAINGCTNGG